MPKQTPSTIEQFAVNNTRDLAIRIVETFHKGGEEEKMEAKRAFLSMCTEMFDEGVKPCDQVLALLKSMREGLEYESWPVRETVGQGANAIGHKAHK